MTRRRAPAAFVPLVSDFPEHYRGKVADWLLEELDRLHEEACGRLLALDTERARRLEAPLSEPLSPEESAAAYEVTPEHAERVAEAVRVARSTSQFELASPGSINPSLLRVMLHADDWPLSALYAVLALAATLIAADCADLADTYRGAAREALALADLADAELEAKEAEARLEAEAPAIATGKKVRAKNRAAGERRGRELRKQGDATRAAVKAARDALGAKATAGAIALRVGITRQRAGQILRELEKAKSKPR